ncbi:glycosyltransferase family 2 protein [Tropicimonas sp. IMCC6043]|uniref:glycosyltransferase family 2 protein n=1 Tax=Tropicimonas sp. IMCC6043 TaxID=2510645 RepID=UPI0013EA9D9C|nr:glycosyltransferase [Tropicimonas sp. IMCC6043]
MDQTTGQAKNRPNPTRVQGQQPRRRLVLGMATVGRREILTESVRRIAWQTRLPDLLLLAISKESDIDRVALADLPFPITVLIGSRDLSAQRNRMLRHLQPADILLCLDDDFLMAPDYLANTLALFERHPEVVVATGTVIGDGSVVRGCERAQAVALLGDAGALDLPDRLRDVRSGHGCNMAIRARPVLKYGLAFDEALPLRSWLEDVDFSRQLAPFGRLVQSDHLCGVHLGIRTGRMPGLKFGYSEIANPIHLMRKGTLSARRALQLVARNLAANLVSSVRSRKRADSRARLRGNMLALGDILRGRIDPGWARSV